MSEKNKNIKYIPATQQVSFDALFPYAFRAEYDRKVQPYMYNEKGYRFFGNPPCPHKKLITAFKQFMQRIPYPFQRINFIEIGCGAGAISYIARCLGFDVIATDIGLTTFPEAWEISRELLNIKPMYFTLSTDNSIKDIIHFTNGRKADYIYMDGVPFNDKTVLHPDAPHERNVWYGQDEWMIVLTDIVQNLNVGGFFMAYLLFGITEELAQQIKRSIEKQFSNKCCLDFIFYFNERHQRMAADIFLQKLP